jgi:hypothetical protein
MGDPQRLLGVTHAADDLERELLGSLRDVAPRAGAKGETWKRLAVEAAAVATIGTGSAAVHAVARSGVRTAVEATKFFTAKVVVGIALAGSTAVGGGWWLHERPAEPASIRSPSPRVVRTAPPPPPSIESTQALTDALASPVESSERTPKNIVETRPRKDALSFESQLLTEARAALHRGDPRAALATVERLRARLPKGVLTQERDVLAIQITSAMGDVATAKRKAEEFLAAHPESPHAPQLRRLTAGP